MRGLVIGKFRPPQNGHMDMINFARQMVDNLTVLVDNIPNELCSIEMEDSVKIIQRVFPDVNVKSINQVTYQEPSDSPNFWDFWKNILLSHADFDVIIGSEDYIIKLAEITDTKYIMYDKHREQIDISATKIRKAMKSITVENADLLNTNLPIETKRILQKNICFLGTESTGKSTITKKLSDLYSTIPIFEYAKFQIEAQGTAINTEILNLFAKGQMANIGNATRRANIINFIDSSTITTQIWSEFLNIEMDKNLVEKECEQNCISEYFLIKPDKYYHMDVHRYNLTWEERVKMHKMFEDKLFSLGLENKTIVLPAFTSTDKYQEILAEKEWKNDTRILQKLSHNIKNVF